MAYAFLSHGIGQRKYAVLVEFFFGMEIEGRVGAGYWTFDESIMTLLPFMSLTYNFCFFYLYIPQENNSGRCVSQLIRTPVHSKQSTLLNEINSYFFTSNKARLKLHYFRNKIQLAYSVE